MTIRNMDILSQSSQHMGVIATDQDGIITVFNAAAENLLGYEAKSLISKMHISKLLGDNNSDVASLMQVATQQDHHLQDHTVQLASGEASQFQLAISPIPGENDKVTGLLILLSRCEGQAFSITDLIDTNTFEKILAREFKRMQRSELAISLLKVHVDNADDLASKLGATEWDTIVNHVGATLFQRIQRAGDVLAYQTGGKFLILLPQTDVAGAVKVSEILRLLVDHLDLTALTDDTISISLGIACMTPTQDDSAADLQSHADQALALAIKEGGDCSRLAEINCTSE